MSKRVYVAQFETVWSLTRAEWIAIAKAGARGEGYELPNNRQLARPPSWIHRNRTTTGFWSSRNDIELVQPLDWSEEQFQEWLDNNATK